MRKIWRARKYSAPGVYHDVRISGIFEDAIIAEGALSEAWTDWRLIRWQAVGCQKFVEGHQGVYVERVVDVRMATTAQFQFVAFSWGELHRHPAIFDDWGGPFITQIEEVISVFVQVSPKYL